jgi:hypothetical protein
MEVTRRKGVGQGKGRQYTSKNSKSNKSAHVSPATVEKFLGGMHYPAARNKLIDNARNKDAPDDVMALLNKLPSKTYTSPIDITKEIGKLE